MHLMVVMIWLNLVNSIAFNEVDGFSALIAMNLMDLMDAMHLMSLMNLNESYEFNGC